MSAHEEPNDTEVVGTDFRSRGMTHSINIFPNDNNTGWIISVGSLGGTGIGNLSTKEGEKLAQMLLGGPGEVKYDCDIHKTHGWCLKCLT